jgi:hypothetical protein
MMRRSNLLLALFPLVLVTACGGKVIFEGGKGTGGQGTGGAGTGGVATGMGEGGAFGQTTVGITVGTAIASSGVGVGGFGSSGTGIMSSASTGDVASSSSGPPPPPTNVYCNGAPCMTGDICCFNPNGPGDHCGQAGNCDPGYVEFSCNEPSDCPGAVCCAQLQGGMQLLGISCQAKCDGPGDIIVCSKAEPNVCPMGTMCQKVNQIGNGYRFCF